jgi:hypothetical protein
MQSNIKRKSPEFKIPAGQMFVENGKVKPNPSKGEMRFSINSDNLLIFEWKDLNTNISSEPLVIFDGEWEWTKIGTQKGRVYCLKNVNFDDKFFFWMQYPNAAEDQANENIITNILKTGRLELNEEKESDSSINSVEKMVNSESVNKTGSDKNNNTGVNVDKTKGTTSSNADFIKSFAQSFRGGKKGKFDVYFKLLG